MHNLNLWFATCFVQEFELRVFYKEKKWFTTHYTIPVHSASRTEGRCRHSPRRALSATQNFYVKFQENKAKHSICIFDLELLKVSNPKVCILTHGTTCIYCHGPHPSPQHVSEYRHPRLRHSGTHNRAGET